MDTFDLKNRNSTTKSSSASVVSRFHITVLSNFARGYDKYSQEYSKSRIAESTFRDKFHLLEFDDLSIGIEKNHKLLAKLDLPNNELIVMETRVSEEKLFVTELTGLGQYVKNSSIHIYGVYLLNEDGSLREFSVEELMARSLMVLQNELMTYDQLTPRSISVLPVAIGCQAKCSFCFSKSSASVDQDLGVLSLEQIELLFEIAKTRGAGRAVITGGGEPTLYPRRKLLDLIRLASKYFPEKVVLITNGYALTELPFVERLHFLEELQIAGLTTLAVSHHHWNPEINRQIMNLDIDVSRITDVISTFEDRFPTLSMRLICVLQKGGIDDLVSIQRYVDWAASLNVQEICFKELYVSTSIESVYYSKPANDWSETHQISLSLLLEYLQSENWNRIEKLPWGSPIYQRTIKGVPMKIAAYTEPSLLWERSNGLCRSWNIMADGRCLTSLEDRRSEVLVP